MSRYIDVENIKLKGISVFDQNLEILIPLSDVRKTLQMTQTAEVVEVVRCKDCEYLYQDGNIKACKHWNCHSTTDDSYCSYAKKKGGVD